MTEVRAKPRTRVVLVAIMVIVVVFLAVFGVLSESAPSTMTKLGKFTGRYKTSYEGNKYEAYEGIPYALPPLADRRFEVSHSRSLESPPLLPNDEFGVL